MCITSLESGFVTVSVRDSGTGLSPENISRLFQEGVQFNANELQVNTAFSVNLLSRILMISRYVTRILVSIVGIYMRSIVSRYDNLLFEKAYQIYFADFNYFDTFIFCHFHAKL